MRIDVPVASSRPSQKCRCGRIQLSRARAWPDDPTRLLGPKGHAAATLAAFLFETYDQRNQ
jgi:hypothetical protein